ncbi:VanZ family protein [Sinomonas sp. ASV322]|uniref:VanZ family protein n=1 Tax=Sinomonas sp. ASV322 TaxID=3041920 RepID=UPI0027DD94D5|nr:VanZ family protein [Sinomonas sp. ASV322]MDQ4504346.1 VanZ family protein [Sinomonas sp. ASV322]
MRRKTVVGALGLYGVALSVLVFAPVGPSLKGVHLPSWLHAGAIGAAANVAVFVPVGLLVALLLPRGWRWLAVAACCALSTFIEIVQWIMLTDRSGNVRDVITNTTGALIGAVLASLWLRLRRPREPQHPADAGSSLSESSTRS